jgi:endonuclease/exonuclease/phosphatase family metal-dependent hydrolase
MGEWLGVQSLDYVRHDILLIVAENLGATPVVRFLMLAIKPLTPQKRTMARLSTTRLIALAAVAALTIGTQASASPTCAPLRVMTYNIRLALDSDGPNRWQARREQFIGQVRLMNPAILGLQEVVAAQKADLERGLPNYAFLGVARDDGRSAGEYSNLAIDRGQFEIRSSGTFWLSPTPAIPSKGWDADYIRIATWAHLVRRSDAHRFLALNTHLDNEGKQARLEGAREILHWLSANRAAGESVLMTGDFNAEPGSPPYLALTSSALGLRDARKISRTPAVGPEGTFNDFQALPADDMRIDYVLVDPGIEVERYAVLAWHGEGNRVASDHFPVVADVAACKR